MVRESIKTKTVNKAVYLEDILQGLTGFARIIHYTNHSLNSAENQKPLCEIDIVEEGEFLEGMRNGYCRVMNATDSSCEVGFFQHNTPMGKYCKYNVDGTYIL